VKSDDALVTAQQTLIKQEKLASLGLLSASIVHEINNPNNVVGVGIQNVEHALREFDQFIRSLMDDEPDPEISAAFAAHFAKLFEQVSQIREANRRIADIVSGMRVASRQDDRMGIIDPQEGLAVTAKLVQTLHKHSAVISLDLGPAVRVKAIESQLNQVFMNLLVNACHAINARCKDNHVIGQITVTSGSQDQQWWVTIADNGCGMTDDVRRQLFEPFFTTKDAGQGTGLGMTICRNILDQHAGRMAVESTPDVGTQITLWLPLVSESG
jgi:signal transduction histidine kinase